MTACGASFGATALMTLLSSLLQAGNDPSQQQLALFEKNDRLILVDYCYDSHSQGTRELRTGLRLDLRAFILCGLCGGENGPAIEVNQPDEILLVQAVRYRPLKIPPQGNKLPHRVIADLVKWVKMGNPDLRDRRPTRPDASPSTAISVHGAFQLAKRHLLPTVRDGAWTIFELEFFILSRFEREAFMPVKDEDRFIGLRCVAFDLTGLPPICARCCDHKFDPIPQTITTSSLECFIIPHPSTKRPLGPVVT